MKRCYRVICLLLTAVVIAVSTIVVTADKTDVIVEGDYAYSIEDDEVTIEGYRGT